MNMQGTQKIGDKILPRQVIRLDKTIEEIFANADVCENIPCSGTIQLRKADEVKEPMIDYSCSGIIKLRKYQG